MAFPVCHYLPVLCLSSSIATDTLRTLHDMHKLLLPYNALTQSTRNKSVSIKSSDVHRIVETHTVNVPVNISGKSNINDGSNNCDHNSHTSNNSNNSSNNNNAFEARVHLRHASSVRIEVHPTLYG